MRIPMSQPSMGRAELDAVSRVLASGWLGEGPETREFERMVAELTGAPHVVAVNTGTSALHLALAALGVGPGDEVILPSFTFASDPMAVRLTGATPVFADIDAVTLNLDPGSVARRLTPKTRALLPTDYAGLPADVDALRRVANGREIRIVRDAAHSFGTLIGGRPVGVWSGEDATCFSFDPIKNVTCGEGGAILVNDEALARRLRRGKTLGFQADARTRAPGSAAKTRGVVETGYRYHMSDINAAIGRVQLGRRGELAEARQAVARRYGTQLAGHPGVTLFERDYEAVVPFLYPVRVAASARDRAIEHLAGHGVHADLRYSPCHLDPLWETGDADLPVTEVIAREVICLPLYAGLSLERVDEVVRLLKESLAA